MKLFKNFLILLWRIWFYILALVPIMVLIPVLLVFTAKERWYPQFFAIARFWARIVLFGAGFYPVVSWDYEVDQKKSYMFVANHTSMTDILLMLYCVKNPFVFVGKKELSKVPVFGFFYKRVCIMVDRESSKSRSEVFQRAQQRIKQGNSICIFPEGGVPDDESIVLDTFKDGAFRLAIDHKLPIIPLTFLDNKKRFSYTFFSGSPGRMRVHIHQAIATEGLESKDKKGLNQKTRNIILGHLNTSK